MKRILLLLLLTVISLNCALPANADKEEYLQFMGIPIEGSVSSFVRKLQSKGFKLVTYVDDNVLLVGNFAGYSDCSVYVCGDNEKKMSHVFVSLPVQSSWSELEKRYSSFFETTGDDGKDGTGSDPGHSGGKGGNDKGSYGKNLASRSKNNSEKKSNYFA